MDRAKKFLQLGYIAHQHDGQMANIKEAKGSAVWVHFDFPEKQNIDQFTQQLILNNVGKLVSSNGKSCRVLV